MHLIDHHITTSSDSDVQGQFFFALFKFMSIKYNLRLTARTMTPRAVSPFYHGPMATIDTRTTLIVTEPD